MILDSVSISLLNLMKFCFICLEPMLLGTNKFRIVTSLWMNPFLYMSFPSLSLLSLVMFLGQFYFVNIIATAAFFWIMSTLYLYFLILSLSMFNFPYV